jgi:hypothetical protein
MTRFIALLASLAAAPAFAWGSAGHSIIAEIAWRELSPEARAELEALLAGNEHGTLLPEIASWADAVRPQEAYQWSAPLHYVNMPPEASGYDHARDCPEVGCVVSAVDRFARELADESLPVEQRREALMFLVHFVGDMHQPLHGGRAEDRGGNDIHITLYDTPTNLHRAWDSQLLEAHDASPWPVLTERLYATIDPTDRILWLADTHEQDWIATAGRWAFESHSLAERYCYIIAPGETVGVAYVNTAAPVIEARLAQAGVRLGAVLQWCADQEPPAEPIEPVGSESSEPAEGLAPVAAEPAGE